MNEGEVYRGQRRWNSGRRKSQGPTAFSNGFISSNAGEMDDDTLSERCRRHDPHRFAVLCQMHLLFLLDLSYHEFDLNPLENPPISAQCATTSASSSSSSRIKRSIAATIQRPRLRTDAPSAGSNMLTRKISLTKECVDSVHQLINFLSQDANLSQEGLFRKSGKKSRQQELYRSVSEGKNLSIGTDCPYNAHDCASVLKMFFADLSEPLLTELHYTVHCQIAGLSRGKEKSSSERQVQSLQLIFLLLPIENRNLLRHLLDLLHRVSQESAVNKMNAVNLALMFAPHILCPRKMPPEELCRKSGDLTRAVAFMIDNAPQLFRLPAALTRDLQVFKDTNDEAIRTTVTFCERRRLRDDSDIGRCVGAVNDTTAVALAQLYAHVQSMPESLKKRQLIKQFNKENKKATPAANATQVLKPLRHRNKSLRQSLKKRLFGRNQRRHPTTHPTVCTKPDLNGISSCKDGLKMNSTRDADAVAADMYVETIRHPAYHCRNAANMVALRAAISQSDASKQQGGNCAAIAGQRQPSSSSLVFPRKNPISLSYAVTGRSRPVFCPFREVIIIRETSL